MDAISSKERTMSKAQGAALVMTLVFAGSAFAQTATPNLDKRQANQEKRIQQGVKSGELTKRESARLEKREAKLEANKQKAKADGVVTQQERANLQREANRDSKAIYRQKHEAQKAK
jgi:hypothetical protein